MYELSIVEGSGVDQANWLVCLIVPQYPYPRSVVLERFRTQEDAQKECAKILDDLTSTERR